MIETFKDQLKKIRDKVKKSPRMNTNIISTENTSKNNKKKKNVTKNIKRNSIRLSKKKINEIKDRQRKIRDRNLKLRLKKVKPILDKIKSRELELKKNNMKDALKAEDYNLAKEKQNHNHEQSLIELGTHQRKTIICKYCKGDGGLNGNCHSCAGTGFVTELIKI